MGVSYYCVCYCSGTVFQYAWCIHHCLCCESYHTPSALHIFVGVAVVVVAAGDCRLCEWGCVCFHVCPYFVQISGSLFISTSHSLSI